ncbi:MAG: ribonuclease E/G [Ignavibacteriaceae bacterium]
MLKDIIINSSSAQTRIAIMEDGSLTDFFVDYPENRRMVGDIYLGQVARVLPGIKAAFINIGLKHDAFLHFSDIGDKTQEMQSIIGDDSDADDDDDSSSIADSRTIVPSNAPKIETINGVPKLQKGQEIIVQITKEPVTGKGVRCSSAVSIPGRFCVLLPFDNKIGISKKISDFKERRRLRSIARSILPKNYGLIIRTVAKNQSEESLIDDLKYLKRIWEEIEEKVKTEKPPSLIHQDLGTTISVIRDLFTPDINNIYIDSKKLFKQIKDYIKLVQPAMSERLELFRPSDPIFEAFKIEEQIKTLMGRKVPLKSGGYLIIEHTEAMVVIDVNSGRYAASKDQEVNSLKTDLEAVREIARQLKLRDIGGLIVVDFIDLEEDKNRKKVYDELKKEFRKDRAKVALLPMSDFGLVEITRQRIRQNIVQAISEPCPHCEGTGLLTKESHIIYDIEEWLKKFKSGSKERSLLLVCHPSIAKTLRSGRIKQLTKLQFKHLIKIKLTEDVKVNIKNFRFISAKTKKDITDEFS